MKYMYILSQTLALFQPKVSALAPAVSTQRVALSRVQFRPRVRTPVPGYFDF